MLRRGIFSGSPQKCNAIVIQAYPKQYCFFPTTTPSRSCFAVDSLHVPDSYSILCYGGAVACNGSELVLLLMVVGSCIAHLVKSYFALRCVHIIACCVNKTHIDESVNISNGF